MEKPFVPQWKRSSVAQNKIEKAVKNCGYFTLFNF